MYRCHKVKFNPSQILERDGVRIENRKEVILQIGNRTYNFRMLLQFRVSVFLVPSVGTLYH